jgi:hypothetical protein
MLSEDRSLTGVMAAKALKPAKPIAFADQRERPAEAGRSIYNSLAQSAAQSTT